MKTVQDDTGKRYLLLKRSEQASLVRDPENGNECYVQNDRLESTGESAFEAVARTIPSPVRTVLTTVHDEKTLGLLLELEENGPLGVRTLLEADDSCESDLHGRLTVLTSAGLIAETDVAGERGYRITDDCADALEVLRGEDESANAVPSVTDSIDEQSARDS